MLQKLFLILLLPIVFLLAPVVLYFASLPTLPGQPLYQLKRNYEALAVLATAKSYPLQSQVQLELLQRRSQEALHSANHGSATGFPLLIDQNNYTQKTINRLPDHPNSGLYHLRYQKIVAAFTQEISQLKAELETQLKPTRTKTPKPTLTPLQRSMLSKDASSPSKLHDFIINISSPRSPSPEPTPFPPETSSHLLEQINYTLKALSFN